MRRGPVELTPGTAGLETGRAAPVSLRCIATSSTLETDDTERQREMDLPVRYCSLPPAKAIGDVERGSHRESPMAHCAFAPAGL